LGGLKIAQGPNRAIEFVSKKRKEILVMFGEIIKSYFEG